MTRLKQTLLVAITLFLSLSMNAQEGNIIIHTVNKGQTLYSISKLYDTTVENIVNLNPGCEAGLSVGQELRIRKGVKNESVKSILSKDLYGTKTHTIQSGETLYRLGKIYGIDPQEICDANPGLSTANFRVGETIRIPQAAQEVKEEPAEVKEEKTPEKNNQGRYIRHKVKRGDTLYSISRKYGISVEEILACNPDIKGNALKRKMTLLIPAAEKKENAQIAKREETVPDNSQAGKSDIAVKKNYNDGVLKVAIVLPFLLDSYAPSEQGRMIEYYQGFLIAVEKLKNAGYSFEINTFDSGPQDKSLNELLSSGKLDEMELIIGAMYPTHNKELARFAKEKDIPLVVPFTNKDKEIYNNPMVYCVNVQQSYLVPDVTEYFVKAFPNANVVFVDNDEEKSNKKEFISALTEELDINSIPNLTIPLSNLTTEETTLITLKEFLREDKENIIIPTSSTANTLNTILPTLQQAEIIDSLDIPDYKLFGYPEWQIYAKDTREQMYEVETYFYATFYSHYSIPEVSRFQDEYIRRYDCGIQNIYPRYGMLGYDTGYYFLLAASIYGEELAEKINEVGYTPIQTGFKFERLKNGAFINKSVNFIHYTPDYRIEKIELEK
ncbi:MAG: LysM peptidoglycan-binding domain-containing protein [Bacteroidaceae bacterium]|nr:LysM peptidoglycan-binding domain-containing protein [Bacteroidaceae bacterium]